MDKKDKQTTRTTRDISTQIEEENLWDLDDDWDDEEVSPDEAVQETSAVEKQEPQNVTETEEVQATEDDPTEEITDETDEFDTDEFASDEPEELPAEEPEELPVQEPEVEEDPPESKKDEPEEQSTISLKETAEEAPVEKAATEEAPEVSKDETSDLPDTSVGGITAPATVALKKLSLNKTEKIALAAVAAVMIGLLVWGCIWLSGKNKIANTRETVDLPVAGKHATVSGLSTFWITPKSGPGVNLNAVVVPSVTITLDEEASGSGALRLYFQNADKNSIGDPITLSFESGKFPNDSNTIEVSASDGFHQEGQFHAYQVDDATPWRVLILEAPSVDSAGSEFENLVNAPVEAKRK